MSTLWPHQVAKGAGLGVRSDLSLSLGLHTPDQKVNRVKVPLQHLSPGVGEDRPAPTLSAARCTRTKARSPGANHISLVRCELPVVVTSRLQTNV